MVCRVAEIEFEDTGRVEEVQNRVREGVDSGFFKSSGVFKSSGLLDIWRRVGGFSCSCKGPSILLVVSSLMTTRVEEGRRRRCEDPTRGNRGCDEGEGDGVTVDEDESLAR